MVNKISTSDFRKTWKDDRDASELLSIAEPHCSYGKDYNRNVAASASLVRKLDSESTRFELALRLHVWLGK